MIKVEGRNVQNSWEMHSVPHTHIHEHAYHVTLASVPQMVRVPGRDGIPYLCLMVACIGPGHPCRGRVEAGSFDSVCAARKASLVAAGGCPFIAFWAGWVLAGSRGVARLNVLWGSHACMLLPGSATWFWLEVSPGACRPLFCCLLTAIPWPNLTHASSLTLGSYKI